MSVCACLRSTVDGRFVCARTDPHPSDWGTDEEGHEWVEATPAQWTEANAALDRKWAGTWRGP